MSYMKAVSYYGTGDEKSVKRHTIKLRAGARSPQKNLAPAQFLKTEHFAPVIVRINRELQNHFAPVSHTVTLAEKKMIFQAGRPILL